MRRVKCTKVASEERTLRLQPVLELYGVSLKNLSDHHKTRGRETYEETESRKQLDRVKMKWNI